jgi:hypothetical protein
MTDADSIVKELGCGPNDVVLHPAAATVEDLVRISSLTSAALDAGVSILHELNKVLVKLVTHEHAFEVPVLQCHFMSACVCL